MQNQFLTIGPYRAVYELHLQNFLAKGYPQIEAAALAQSVVARPIPESLFICKAAYLQEAIPQALFILEFNQFEGVSLKVQQAVNQNKELFSDADDPSDMTLVVGGVYAGLVVVEALETGCVYAADWKLEGSKVTFSNVRTVSTYYYTMIQGVTEGLLPALDAVQESLLFPLEVERDFLSALVAGQAFIVPEVKIDGARPVEEIEYFQYLRATKALTESHIAETKMPAGQVSSELSKADALVRLALVASRISFIESQAFDARLALARPVMGSRMTEKSTTIQSVIDAPGREELRSWL